MNLQLDDIQTKRMRRINRAIVLSAIGAALVYLAVLIVIVVQLFSIQEQQKLSNEEAKKNDTANHARTQQYIRCIADALLVPMASRDDINFDDCSNDNTDAKDNPTQSSTSGNQTAVAPTPQTPSQSSRNEPTTSAPPDPTKPAKIAPEPRILELNALDGRLKVKK